MVRTSFYCLCQGSGVLSDLQCVGAVSGLDSPDLLRTVLILEVRLLKTEVFVGKF